MPTRQELMILLLLVLSVTGCLGTEYMVAPNHKPDFTPQNGMATLVIIRDQLLGRPFTFENYLDGKFIGNTTGGKYFVTLVKPGPHYIVVKAENIAVAHLNFAPGKTYYIHECLIPGNILARTCGFNPLTLLQAEESINKCEYLERDPATMVADMDPKLYLQAIADYLAEVKANPAGFKDMLEYRGI